MEGQPATILGMPWVSTLLKPIPVYKRESNMMNWSTRPPQTSSLHPKNLQNQGPRLSQQLTAECDFSPANTLAQNSYNFPGKDRTVKMHCNTKRLADQLPHGGFGTLQLILPKTTKPSEPFEMTQHLVDTRPISHVQLSTVTVQMPDVKAQNSWPSSNIHVFSPATFQGSTVNPGQNTIQKPLNQYMSPYNHPPQSSSNSVRLLVYQQGNKSNSSSKRQSMLTPYYHVNGPSTSQECNTAHFNQASNNYLNSQQNVSCSVFPSRQNIQNQINGPSSRSTIALESQPYSSGPVNLTQYTVPTNRDYRDTTHSNPQVGNINLPPPYPVPPVQTHHGQLVLPHPVPNISNENVQNHQNFRLDQGSIICSAQHYQKPQSIPIPRETNEVGSTTYSANGTVSSEATSTTQTTKMLVQEDNQANGTASLALDLQQLHVFRKACFKIKDRIKHKLYLCSMKNRNTSGHLHNQNSNPSLPSPCDTSQRPLCSLPQDANRVFEEPSHGASQNQPFSPASHSSGQILDTPSSRKKDDIYPILKYMLQGTIDEDMLLNTFIAKTGNNLNRHVDVQEGCSSSTLLASNGDMPENTANSIKTSGMSPQTSTLPSQESLCAQNYPCIDQNSRSAKNHLDKMSGLSVEDVFNHIRLNKDTTGTVTNKIATSLQNSVQNAAVSNRSSVSTENIVKESSEKSQCPQSVCSELLQQSKSASLETPEKKITTGNTGSVSDMSNSAPLVAKAPIYVSEADIIHQPLVPGNPCTIGGACSLEELETSLALWTKNMHIESTESTVSSSSSVAGDKTQHTLGNLSNALTQNDQNNITIRASEINSTQLSLGNKLDTASSSSLKGSEPQVAIVTPLIQSKESSHNEVEKKNCSTLLERMYPIIEESSVHSLQEIISTVPDADKGVGRTIWSLPHMTLAEHKVGSDMHQKAAKSMDESGIVKAEMGTNYSCDFNQNLSSHSSLELKKIKAQVSSGDNLPPETNTSCLNPVPQQCLKSQQSGPDFIELGDAAAVVLNDTMLQISSVCTLVEGDEFYNSQIASMFTTNPLQHNLKNCALEEQTPYPQHNEQQSDLMQAELETNTSASVGDVLLPSQDSLLKIAAEKLADDLPDAEMLQSGNTSDQMTVRNSEEEKSNHVSESSLISGKKSCCSAVHSTDLGSSSQDISGNKGVFHSTVKDGSTCVIKEDVPIKGNYAHCESNIEYSITLLNDQLTELLKEFPNGITSSERTEIEDSMMKLTDGESEEVTQTSGQNVDPLGVMDQIKITLLNSQQQKKYFPEHSRQSFEKLDDNKNDELIINEDDKGDLKRDDTNHVQSDQAMHIDENKNATTEMLVVQKETPTYCCLQGWIASGYAVKPCSCESDKDVGLKQEVDLWPQSKIKVEEKPKGTENYKADCRLNKQLQTSKLHPANNLSSGDQSNTILNIAFKPKECKVQMNDYKSSKVDKHTQFPFLEKLDTLNTKATNEQAIDVLPLHAISQSLKTKKVEINKRHNQTCIRKECSADQGLCHSSTEDVKMVAARSIYRIESSNIEKTPRKSVVVKPDTRRHKNVEIKRSKIYDRYKIKRDSSETHMIKGPTYKLNKGLKRQMPRGKKCKTLGTQHIGAINSSVLSTNVLASERDENSQNNSAFHSQKHFNKEKWGKGERDLEKNSGIEQLEDNQSSCSPPEQQNKGSIKRIDLAKYAYSKERKNVPEGKSSHVDNTKPSEVQKLSRHHFNMLKMYSYGKEDTQDTHKRDKRHDRPFSDKKASYNRRINKLLLHREQKKNYLNRVSFTRTTQERICLKKLEPSPSKQVWHVKSSNTSECFVRNKRDTPPSQQPKEEKPQMLEFKMCPEILFRDSVLEERTVDSKKLPEQDRIPIAAVKSKREDWLKCSPVKRRKTVENEAQVDDQIPLDTAMKFLEGNEALHMPVKDSNATFQTYRKMHLEKRSQSLDSHIN